MRKYSRHLSNYIEQDVVKHFEVEGDTVDSIEDARNNRNSPFYGKLNFAPSTGFNESDLFKHRFYKVTVIKKDGSIAVKWIDCLYFLKSKCWFVVEE